MYTRRFITHLAIISALCFVIIFQAQDGYAEQGSPGFMLRNVTSDIGEDSLTLTLHGSSSPAYTTRELYDPHRLIVDIAEMDVADTVQLGDILPDNSLAELQTTVVQGLEPEITRFTFTLADGDRQKVERRGNNLEIQILSGARKPAAQSEDESLTNMTGNEKIVPGENNGNSEAGAKIRDLIQSTAEAVDSTKQNGGTTADKLVENFDFAGYKRERISIDFYKIDLHNVFRLFRQVSDMNLIVDEGVSGSLTLALNDVPWDFALDIILNLADLEKEEKFNTIVVYPKDKEFAWPERATDNLSFQADLEVVEQEALIIEQSANQPKEIMQAKEYIRKARAEEQNENYEDAVQLYAQAADLWPSNARLTSKLAAIHLVRLGMNAQAIFYAEKSLEADPENYNAALYAAIGSANMNRVEDALEYFNRSISGDPPKKEALGSFAAFSESNGRPEAALKLYDKYHSIYGETVDTMVAQARIYDRMGMKDKAVEKYRAVVASGFQMQYGLKQYIQSRLAEARQ